MEQQYVEGIFPSVALGALWGLTSDPWFDESTTVVSVYLSDVYRSPSASILFLFQI